jgi:hypothetical protein
MPNKQESNRSLEAVLPDVIKKKFNTVPANMLAPETPDAHTIRLSICVEAASPKTEGFRKTIEANLPGMMSQQNRGLLIRTVEQNMGSVQEELIRWINASYVDKELSV